MGNLFLSYSRRDSPFALALHDELVERSGHEVFLDTDRRTGLIPSTAWREGLLQNLRRSSAVVYVASDSSNTSVWCASELAVARYRGVPIFVVLATVGGPLPDTVSDLLAVPFADTPAAQVTELLAALGSRGIPAPSERGGDVNRPPYPGMDAFQEADGQFFFGRDDDLEEILPIFAAGVPDRGSVIAIEASSGSGKSSFARALLVPRLRRVGWQVAIPIEPDDDPAAQLSRVLEKEPFGASGPLADKLAAGTGRRLIVVDQAERLITSTPDDAATSLIAALRDAVRHGWWVLMLIRTEFTIPTTDSREVLDLIDRHVVLPPLTRDRLRQAIVEPGRMRGMEFDDEVIARMLDSVVGTDALPMLGYTLQFLYAQSETHGRLGTTVTLSDYGDGVEGILAQQAGEALADLERQSGSLRGTGPDDSTAVKSVDPAIAVPTIARLVAVRPFQPPTGRAVRLDQLGLDEQAALDPFQRRRIVTRRVGIAQTGVIGDGDDASGADGPGPESAEAEDALVTVGMAHESLIEKWEPLRQHIVARRNDLEFAVEVEADRDRWSQSGASADYLLRSDRLRRAESGPLGSRDDLAAFITASRKAERRRSRNRTAVIIGGALGAIASVLAVLLFVRSRQLDDEQRRTEAHQLAERALRQAGGPNDVISRLLAVDAFHRSPDATTEGALLDVASRSSGSRVNWDPIAGAKAVVGDVIEGQVLVAGDLGLAARTFDGSAATPAPVVVDASPIARIAISADGSRLVTGGVSVTVEQVADGLQELSVPVSGTTTHLSINAAADVIAWSDATQSVHVRRLGEDSDMVLPDGLVATVRDLALDSSGRYLALAGDRRIDLVDLDKATRTELTGHSGPVLSVAFLPADDPPVLISGGSDDAVVAWQVGPSAPLGVPLPPVHGADVAIIKVASGGRMATADSAGRIVIWDRSGATWQSAPPIETAARVIDLTWLGPQQLAVLGPAGAIQTINLASGLPLYAEQFDATVGSLVVPLPGRRAVVTAVSNRLEAIGEGPVTVTTEAEITAAAFSLDGSVLITGDRQGTLTLRSPDTLLPIEQGTQEPSESGPSGTGSQIVTVAPFRGGYISIDQAGVVTTWGPSLEVGPQVAHGSSPARTLAIRSDGSEFAVGFEDGSLQRYRIPEYTPIGPVQHRQQLVVSSLAYSLDGHRLYAGSDDRTILVWPTAGSAEPVTLMEAHEDKVTGLSEITGFSGVRLVSIGEDGKLVVWDVDTLLPIAQPVDLGSQAILRALVIAPGDRGFVTLRQSRTPEVTPAAVWWQPAPESVARQMCATVTELPSDQLWEQFGSSTPPASICPD